MNGQCRYKYILLRSDLSYFAKKHSDSTKTFHDSVIIIIIMFEFLIDNIFAVFSERFFFLKTVGIPIGTNYAHLLADWFLYSHETDFIQGLLKKIEKKLARSFNFTIRYTDHVLSLNNSRFYDFVDRIYPIELEIQDTTGIDSSATYLGLHLEIGSEGRLRTKLYDKRDDFNFPIVNFPFICSSIPAYGVYIYISGHTIFQRLYILTRKLLKQGHISIKLKSFL